jgi:hypothetical protein
MTEQNNDMVSVAGFRDPMEAQLAKGMLEAAGVECILQGENANALYPGALRVKLQVRVDDEDTARFLLQDAERDTQHDDGF